MTIWPRWLQPEEREPLSPAVLAGVMQMSPVRPQDPFIVHIQETDELSMRYSHANLKEALKGAINAHDYGQPNWVEVVDQKQKVIITRERTEAAYQRYCKRKGITFSHYLVRANLSTWAFEITPLSAT